mgnify:FL=1
MDETKKYSLRSKKDESMVNQIEIYPNPTSGLVELKLPQHYNGRAVVYNTTGHPIKSVTISDSDVKEIDLSELGGVFYVQFRSLEGEVITKKIIVLK